MNTKLLFAAMMGLALVGPVARADEAPVASAAVTADVRNAPGAARLHHTDYDDELAARPAPGPQALRDDVRAALKVPADRRLVGPLRSKTYNPYGTELMRESSSSRAEVRSQVLEARAEHALRPAGEAAEQAATAVSTRQAPTFLARLRSHGG